MVPNFLYSYRYHFFKTIIIIIIIILLILIYYYYHSYFLATHENCVPVVFVMNSNILLVYIKSGTNIFNNLRFFFITSKPKPRPVSSMAQKICFLT